MLIDLKYFHFIGNPLIIFKPDGELSHEPDEVYKGNIHADELKIWAQEKCIPLVRLVKRNPFIYFGNICAIGFF